ncbi:Bax inhibitor-1 family protein [Neptuniibacter sp. QD37_11]|uniref:Bax inhibitor-1 family protein n=1 Tax=Neptuniibacter sp. QD37_11 TaxID=3398209 RepID=UPI0039F48CB6
MLESSQIFGRQSSRSDELNARAYNFVVGLVILYGFIVNWAMVSFIPVESIQAMNVWVLLIGYFVSCIAGIMIFTKSDNALVSFGGYNLVVVPFGLLLNLFVAPYSPDLVLQAVILTGAFTAIMMALGTMYPAFFDRLGPLLFVSLLAMIVVELVMIFVLGEASEWTDWVVAAIFCGYIAYDWQKANRIPKTLDNAVDSAAALYMDIVNLFVRILSILGNSSGSGDGGFGDD